MNIFESSSAVIRSTPRSTNILLWWIGGLIIIETLSFLLSRGRSQSGMKVVSEASIYKLDIEVFLVAMENKLVFFVRPIP
ncbi:MAG: hypothetical protein LBT86_03865 [Deltaproteobacteria bacterium]|jgi:hypothetical protein|nr:hypothetical protein [Deltaproteobacteria bacterium]